MLLPMFALFVDLYGVDRALWVTHLDPKPNPFAGFGDVYSLFYRLSILEGYGSYLTPKFDKIYKKKKKRYYTNLYTRIFVAPFIAARY